jgi:hypothetical protein
MEIRHIVEFVTYINEELAPTSVKAVSPEVLEKTVKAANLAVLKDHFLPIVNEHNAYAVLEIA